MLTKFDCVWIDVSEVVAADPTVGLVWLRGGARVSVGEQVPAVLAAVEALEKERVRHLESLPAPLRRFPVDAVAKDRLRIPPAPGVRG